MYNILEVANTHAGNINYVFALLEEFKEFNKVDNFGIKFQPFKYDTLATVDYEWYDVYTKLYFDENEWDMLISKAYETKDIWIDLFDEYGISIIKQQINKIFGIKLQTSVLDNSVIFQELSKLKLTNIKLIINIAGRDKEDISIIIDKYSKLNVQEILIEVGFQSYPTKLEDAGLAKIKYLQNTFSNKIVFADHIDGKIEDAVTLPLIAVMAGASYIEKHIMHSSLETKYDYFSSVVYNTYKKMISLQKKYLPLLESPFINDAEAHYLQTTYQMPLANLNKEAMTLLDCKNDFKFRRSNLYGLTTQEIKELISQYYLLNTDKKEGEPFKKEDFKKANISAIIACRLKSTRLPKKAILKVNGLSSIELCIKNTLKLNNINNVILATSDNEQDSELKDYTYNQSVIFHQGDPDDVIQRYIDIIDKLKIDVVIRITGDMQYVSADIADYLLKSHFDNGADYTVANEVAVGTGVEIINSSALKRIKKYLPNTNYSEYMNWYIINNPNYFKLNFVDLPKQWIRDYRLTLDYQEDLDMFIKIEEYFQANKIEYSIDELYKFLDTNENISSMNSHLTLKYKTDQALIDTLNRETKFQ